MSEKKLSQYYYLKKEVEDLENRIKEFGSGVKSVPIKEVSVSSSHKKKSIQETKVELVGLLTEKRISALEQYIEIERYIEEVDDVEIRSIMRYRYLDLMKWEEIGAKMFQERTTIYKKMKRYLKENKNGTRD